MAETNRYERYIRKALECEALKEELAETKTALELARRTAIGGTAVMVQGRDCAVCACEPAPIPNCPGCGGVGGFTKVAIVFP